jgi:hypothetical protein
MKLSKTLRSWHKWLGLLLGIQLLIWSLSGFYMVALNIDFIHGDHLIRAQLRALERVDGVLTIPQLAEKYPELLSARLTTLPDLAHPVYELVTNDSRMTIDAVSGEALSPFSQDKIEELAMHYYAGDGRVVAATLLDATPVEARGRRAPLWRVDFDDRFDASLYLDPDSGALVTRRHRWWRLYDTFWMLHLMDYGDERDDVNNKLLRTVASAATITAITGLWLLYFSFGLGRGATNGARSS